MIVFLFDGTANGYDDPYPSNIRILHEAIEGSYYFEGPGNNDNIFSRVFGGAAGVGSLSIIARAIEKLEEVYEEGEEIVCFGFSRGAANCRRFAYQVCKDGVNGHYPGIKFEGCFDTVFAATPFGWFQQRSLFGDLHIHSDVKQAVHAVSIHEDRKPFIPNLMNQRDGVTEVWFDGVHSDVGGGYHDRGLADISLHWMIEKAPNIGMDIRKIPKLGSSPLNIHTVGGYWGSRAKRKIGVKSNDKWTDTPAVIHPTSKYTALI